MASHWLQPIFGSFFQGVFLVSFVFISWQLLSPAPITSVDISDKLVHFLVFGLLALSLDWGWYQRGSYWLFRALPLIVYGGLIEIIQYFVPGRSMSFADWLADAAGVLAYPVGMLLLLQCLALLGYRFPVAEKT